MRLPRGLAHPGLCPVKTLAIYHDGAALAEKLGKHAKATFQPGDFILIKTDPPSEELRFMVG